MQLLNYKKALIVGAVFTCHLAMTRLSMAQQWQPIGSTGLVPFDAISAGWAGPPLPDVPKTPLYACRGGRAEGLGLQLGRFEFGSAGCDFGYGGKEFIVPDFDLLVMTWQAESGGLIPPNAVQGGSDTPLPRTGFRPPLYFCRGRLKDGFTSSLQLGKIRADFGGCLVPWSGKEILIGNYEVLVSLNPALPLATVSANKGFVPQDAIQAGTDVDGTPLYICSAVFNDGTHPGKLHSSFGGCNISYGGVEHTISDYFVLVPDWLGSSKFDFPAGVDTDGSPLHVCRALLNGGIEYPGKMRSTWTTCSYGLAGKEQAGAFYEVLSH